MILRIARVIGACLAMWFGNASAQALNYQDLWWAGPQENGWGLSISQQGSTLFVVLYIYDAAGKPQWVVMPDARWNTAFDSVSGSLYQPTGSPLSNYDASRFVVGAAVGTATIDFASTSSATLRYTVNGASGNKTITRQVFGSGPPLANYTDLWWGGATQNGWGISLTQQGSNVFGVWYTYDAQGKTTWLVMPDGKLAGNVVSGSLYRTSGSAWAGATYDPSRFQAAPAGNMSFTFGDASSGIMRFTVDGSAGSVDVVRQPFGAAAPVAISSFAKLHEKVIVPACLSCHTAGHPYAIQSGLVLDAPVAYRNLLNGGVKLADALARGITKLIAPRDVANSFFHRKLLLWDSAQPALGSPMPLGNTSLSVGQLEFVKRWIEAGAPEQGDVVDASLLDDTTLPTFAPFAPLNAPAAGKGYQIRIDPFQVAPNFERELFVYRALGNPQPIFVSRFESRMRNNSHHLLLYDFEAGTPATVRPQRDVVRDIRNPDNSLNFVNMLPMGYHVFVGGSMSPNGGYSFPAGVAMQLPANAALDFNVHYVNSGATPITGEAYANLYTIDASQVQHVASTLDLGNTSFQLPPLKRTTITKSFAFAKATRVLMLTSHTHKLGERFEIRLSGGPRNGEVVYVNTEWEHPNIVTFDPPLLLQPGEGLTSVITYNNTTNRTISFGLTSEDEMGIIFGYHY